MLSHDRHRAQLRNSRRSISGTFQPTMEPRDVLQIYAELDEELANMDEPETPQENFSCPARTHAPSRDLTTHWRPPDRAVTNYKSRNLCAKYYADYSTTTRKKKMETN